MSGQTHKQPQSPQPQTEDATVDAKDVRDSKLADEVEDMLDEIDDVLEENAAEFVRAFVQKGGQ